MQQILADGMLHRRWSRPAPVEEGDGMDRNHPGSGNEPGKTAGEKHPPTDSAIETFWLEMGLAIAQIREEKRLWLSYLDSRKATRGRRG